MNGDRFSDENEWLKIWRVRAGMDPQDVDRRLRLPPGTTITRERNGIFRIELCLLVKLADIYNIDYAEMLDAIYPTKLIKL